MTKMNVSNDDLESVEHGGKAVELGKSLYKSLTCAACWKGFLLTLIANAASVGLGSRVATRAHSRDN